ncbi:MAG: replication initiator A domain-containing protein, partial [Bacteroidaceae bacterium]|nr:replication initiator A domain-containing protein [Bacteroidaceae bacterium]
NPIISAEDVDKDEDERQTYYEYFREQLAYEALLNDFPYEEHLLEEILDLIVDTVCTRRKQIRIAGDDKPVNVVKSRFMKLTYSHISYVLSCMKESSPDIRNIKQYILAALYNAPMTIDNYYSAMYHNDHANGLI